MISAAPCRIAILASGTGTSAQALLDASGAGELAGGRVVLVVSDRREAHALERARRAGVEAVLCDPGPHPDRASYGDRLLDLLGARHVDLVCMAGFMRILSPGFIQGLGGRVLNIHPSLLPAFPGAHAVRDALRWGVKVTGTTVHFADELVDHGPIIAQECVRVLPDDDEERLHARIKQVEHRLYPEAVRLVIGGHARVVGRAVLVGGTR
ncbi:MAG: phosphoribosylglycinamide formyltransferase [Actinomycetota bacterium]